jgi:hypothetical protein
VIDMVEWLDDLRNRMALMAVLMEYPVTQEELEDIATSDSLTGDYLDQDLSPSSWRSS